MIPKKIHYCWFGGKPLPDDAKSYIESWKKFCPDYEIIEWNEKTFDLYQNTYVKEAFENKKWAFITDYVRLWVIYNYGGIYMDTDVEVLKNLDDFLKHPAFSGFESSSDIPTGIMAGEKENNWFKLQLAYYDNRHFVNDDGSLDLTTNVITITNITKANYSISLNNSYQDLGDVVFYPSDYFCPKSHETGIINCTENTYCIHHFAGSWVNPYEKKVSDKTKKIYAKYGVNFFSKLLIVVFRISSKFNEFGFKKTLRYYIYKEPLCSQK